MNTKALITTLAIVVGSSSVAMARPATVSVSGSASVRGSISFGTSNYVTAYQNPSIRDHRTPVRQPVRPVRQPVLINHGTYNTDFGSYSNEMPYGQGYFGDWLDIGTRDSGTSSYITMPTNEPVRALHLEATSGRPAISSVFVRYHDGSQIEIPVNSNLSARGLNLSLVVKNSPIHQIIFYSPAQAKGTFTAFVAK